MLDNDYTFIINNNDVYMDVLEFDSYIGWSDGVVSLLEAMGIEAECV